MITYIELVVDSLGGCQHLSPLNFYSPSHPQAEQFVPDKARIRSDLAVSADAVVGEPSSLELAGPREAIFFDPAQTTAAIVTCGGLSPGLNNVIRSAFCQFTESYGLPRVLGIRNGYLGLNPESRLEPIVLTREYVESIDKLGGTVLGELAAGRRSRP